MAFNNYTQSEVTLLIREQLHKLSEENKEISHEFDHKFKKFIYPGFGIGFVLGAVFFYFGYLPFAIICLLPAVIYFIVLLVQRSSKRRDLRLKVKRKVFSKLTKAIYPNVEYFPSKSLKEEEFDESDLFTNADRYSGEDLFEGMLDKTHFRMSEIHAESKHKDNKGNTHYNTIFKGVMLIADVNKAFGGVTRAEPDYAERIFGKWLGSGLQRMSSRLQLVKLENVEFEKYFVVNSSDQIEARYLITPKLMEAILELRRTHSKSVAIAFKENHIYIALSSTENRFEVPKNLDLHSPTLVQEFLNDLQHILSVIDLLDLNTRIWTKE